MDKEEFHWLSGVVQGMVFTRKSFIGSLVSCRVGFQQDLGQKSMMRWIPDLSCQHSFLGHQQPQGHNKQESTTFILSYGSNKLHCMDKEEFHWLFGVVQGWFSARLGSKIAVMMDPINCQHTVSLATNSHRDITNRNQPLLVFHMDPTNSIVWTRKSFIGSLVSYRVWFSARLGSKINDDGFQLLSAQFPWPPTATGT
jgi:hypothetical protein